MGTGACLQAACDIQATVPPSRRLALQGAPLLGLKGAPLPDIKGAPLHDPCAIAWLIRPDLFTTRPCHIEIDLGPGPSRGRTVIDRWSATPNARLLETLDPDAFFALLGQRLASLP